jgi:predicted nuclease of predicted toxin-antitoxin system
MRLLIDAQLPPALCDWFAARGFEAAHVSKVLGGQTPDREISRYVEERGLILVTKDDDFLLRYPPVQSRLLWFRCGNISNRALGAWLEACWPEIEARLRDGETVVEVR